jgi:transposase
LEAALEGEILRDDQWARIEPFVPGGRKGKRGPRSNGRLFVDALLWMVRSGARWKDLPERFGPPDRAKQRYYRWLRAGVLTRIFEAVSAEPDLEWLMLDATVIRAHLHAAGAPKKRGDRAPRRLVVRAAASGPSCMSA